ncbi:MAG TPA: nuclear transport factor 2 family protein [Polyangiaceae bacterium]|jgi:ketosteroid isomerase-like protein|nr:nuclear transport factor 2 family protein [Polyangiaceae bacterium]
MTNEEEAVQASVLRFYDAIDQMAQGKGLDAMSDAWHHTEHVTGGHPSGGWAHGWDEVWATWKVFASFGAPGRGGSKVEDVTVHVFGDVAYSTCSYVAPAEFGGETLSCTNVLHRVDGAWKIIHHHADKSLAMVAALEKLATGG